MRMLIGNAHELKIRGFSVRIRAHLPSFKPVSLNGGGFFVLGSIEVG